MFGNSSLLYTTATNLTTAVAAHKENNGYSLSSRQIIAFTCLNCVMSTVGSVSNAMILLSTLISYHQPNTNIIALLSLCIADILVCGLFQPLYIYRIHFPEQNNAFISLQVFIGHISILASLNSVLLIAIDRVVAVFKPLRYIVWITSRRLYKVTAVLWTVASTLSALRLVGDLQSILKLAVYVYSFVAFLITVILCLAIYRESIVASRKVCVATSVCIPRHKATKSTLMILTFFIVSWMPHILAPAFINLQPEMYAKALPWLNTFINFNSASNPFIYYFRYKMFRKAFRRFVSDSSNNFLVMFSK